MNEQIKKYYSQFLMFKAYGQEMSKRIATYQFFTLGDLREFSEWVNDDRFMTVPRIDLIIYFNRERH